VLYRLPTGRCHRSARESARRGTMTLMEFRISEEPIDRLDQHAKVPIAVRVERMLSVSVPASGLGGIRLSEAAVQAPWVKNYDAINGEGPTTWSKRFDTSNWGLIAAHEGPQRIGGAVIALNTGGVHMLEGRSDTAVLWDLRVRPEHRSAGIGSALFRPVETWCGQRACVLLKVVLRTSTSPLVGSRRARVAPSAASTPGPITSYRTRPSSCGSGSCRSVFRFLTGSRTSTALPDRPSSPSVGHGTGDSRWALSAATPCQRRNAERNAGKEHVERVLGAHPSAQSVASQARHRPGPCPILLGAFGRPRD
jgi:GNAT superfamily N-acetyltransferase